MEWKTVKISDIAYIINGGTPKTSIPEYWDGDIPWLSVKDFNTGLKYVSSAEKHITQEGLEHSATNLLEPEDIIISARGTIGVIAMLSRPMAFNQSCFGLKARNFDAHYLYYLLKEKVKELQGQSQGSVFDTIVRATFDRIECVIPATMDDQRRIAAILSSLDDKIENNNRINRNLEAQAQALFKSWFIDFEPFGGVIPENWIFDNISAFPHILETGRRPKGGAVESGLPSIGAEHIKGMGTYDYSKTKYITEEYARSMRTGKINGYELLIYKDGGKPGYFIPNFTIYGEGYPFEECYINEHVLKLDFPDKAFNIFCYFYFQEPEVMTYLNAQGGKAAIPGINKSDIENINVLSPGNEVIKQFGDIVMPYFTTILRNLKENQRLATLRDTLLPKLMKGEIAL